MPYRYQEFQANEYHHIYHRDRNRQKIFFEAENYTYFLACSRNVVPNSL